MKLNVVILSSRFIKQPHQLVDNALTTHSVDLPSNDSSSGFHYPTLPPLLYQPGSTPFQQQTMYCPIFMSNHSDHFIPMLLSSTIHNQFVDLPFCASMTAGSTFARSSMTLACFSLMISVCLISATWISWDVTFLRSASC